MNYTFTLRKLLFFLIVFTFVSTQVQGQTRPKYRTFDGTLNNLSYPQFGKSGIPLYREIPAAYGTNDPKNALGGQSRPTPRAISNRLSNEPEDVHNKRDMSGLFYSWGQFLDHDITLTPTNSAESAPISLPSDEKIFKSPIPFSRSAVHPGTGVTTPRDQTNLQTSWVDGSQVYGWTPAIANWLRTFSGGKMKVSKGNLLPFNTVTGEYDSPLDLTAPKMDDDNGRTKKTFAAGDPRAAEHPGLTSLHTIFVREHNKICDRLKSQGMTNDEEIYQKARKEVGALIQAITYGQWISSLGVQLTSYSGYKSGVRPDIRNTFSTAAYRWHTMVENDIIFRDNDCHGVGPSELPLKEVFFNIEIVRKYDIGVLLKGLSVHRSYETDLKVNSGLRNFLFGPGSGLDLVSLNIQRGRDHGLPDYNKVRQYYTGTSAYTFYDIAGSSRTSVSSMYPSTPSKLISDEMSSLYGNVNNVDLWVGCYAEPLMSGKSVGKTVDAILRTQLQALRDGDYYYYMNDPELAYDRARLASTKLGDVIARNSNAGNFQDNVFYRKSCSSNGDDIAHYSCNVTPQFDGWTFIGKTGSKTYYKWNGANANFYEAQLLVKRIGGSLPQVKNTTENNALKTYLGGGSAWLDLNRNGSLWQYSGIFNVNDVFVPGAYSNFFSWNTGEPNNYGGIENRAEMTSSGKWNDVSETSLKPVIAEVSCIEDCANDVAPPVFTYCPPSINASVGLLSLCKPVSWTNPTATDNCSVSVSQIGGLWNGSCFLPGTNTITYAATDAKGNKSYCSFKVNITKTLSLFSLDQTIVSLEAKAEPNRTSLQWVSNLSTNENDYFIVKKLNPNSQEFDDLAIVNNTSSTNDFAQFVHYDSAPTEGDNFYKITAVLYDGSTKESEVKKVNFGKFSFVNVYPNPTDSELNIDLKGYQDSPVSVYLYNSLGQPLLIKHVDAAASSLIQMDVTNIPVGQYLMRVTSKGKKDITKQVSVSH